MASDTEVRSYLQYLSYRGIIDRLGESALEPGSARRERVDTELGVINEVGYPSYFLIVRDLVLFARQRDIPVGPGRGSVCGSLVAYALRITDVDPMQWDIPFERFLHTDRIAPPDIDIDFCQRRRGEIIAYLRERYGEDRVTQILTFGTMQARSVLRETARLLHLDEAIYGKRKMGKDSIAEELAQMVPEGSGIDQVYLSEFLQEDHGRELSERIDELEGKVRYNGRPVRIRDTLLRLEGMRRHGSVHAAGVVVSDVPLIERVPLYRRTKDSDLQTQFEHTDVEAVGLLKLDVLGLRTITVLGEVEGHVREFTGDPDWSWQDAPLDDGDTFALLRDGDTDGVFQLEGEGITAATQQVVPERFDDIAALISLYRPGPMEQIPEYAARKSGEKPAEYFSEELKPLFERTYGLMVFQEQVMGIARVMGGYTAGEADSFRKAIGKKLADLIEEEIGKWKRRSLERGYDEDLVDKLAHQISRFGRYGFNQAHAYGYAYITYWTAWAKANHPAAFYTALLNGYIDNTDKVRSILHGARAHGISLLPPDINRSGRWYTAEEGGIRFGVAAVRGMGDATVKAVLEERDERWKDETYTKRVRRQKDDGSWYMANVRRTRPVQNDPRPFDGFMDFCRRLPSVPINAKENLIVAGAFGSGMEERRALLSVARDANKRAKASLSARVPAPAMESAPTESELIQAEREVMGMYVSSHPFDMYERQLRRFGARTHGRWERLPSYVVVAGIVTRIHEHQSKRGRMAWVTLETDITGMPDVTIFPDTYAKAKEHLRKDALVLIRGERTHSAQYGRGFRADWVLEFDRARPPISDLVVAFPASDGDVQRVLSDLSSSRGAPVHVVPYREGTGVVMSTSLRVPREEAALARLEDAGALLHAGHYADLPGWDRVGDPWAGSSDSERPWDWPEIEAMVMLWDGTVVSLMEAKG